MLNRLIHELRYRTNIERLYYIRNQLYNKLIAYSKPGYFNLNGTEYLKYFVSNTNQAKFSERKVEVPLVLYFINKYFNGTVLEFGDVLTKYGNIPTKIVDLGSKRTEVLNKDICTIYPKPKYDHCISVSTIEHTKNPRQTLTHILRNILKPKGILVYTVPVGVNPKLDNMFSKNMIHNTEEYWFKRISMDNRWIQVNRDSALKSKYGYPYHTANAIVCGVIRK